MRKLPQPFVALIMTASLLLSAAGVAAQSQTNAQNATTDWSKVTALASGSKLSVKLKNGKTVNGTLSSVSDSTLCLTSKNAPVEIKRDDVRTVHEVIKKSSATKAALIGTGVGAGAGAAAGAISDSNSDGGFEKLDSAATAGLAVVGAGVGALVGYFVGRSGAKRVLVYEAK
jgi:small nuclear ribonucleoprotein (snRNP)-like protein